MKPFKKAPICYRKSLGVCAGLAYSLNTPVWIIRLIFFITGLFGVGVTIYLVLAVVLSEWRDAPDGMEPETILI